MSPDRTAPTTLRIAAPQRRSAPEAPPADGFAALLGAADRAPRARTERHDEAPRRAREADARREQGVPETADRPRGKHVPRPEALASQAVAAAPTEAPAAQPMADPAAAVVLPVAVAPALLVAAPAPTPAPAATPEAAVPAAPAPVTIAPPVLPAVAPAVPPVAPATAEPATVAPATVAPATVAPAPGAPLIATPPDAAAAPAAPAPVVIDLPVAAPAADAPAAAAQPAVPAGLVADAPVEAAPDAPSLPEATHESTSTPAGTAGQPGAGDPGRQPAQDQPSAPAAAAPAGAAQPSPAVQPAAPAAPAPVPHSAAPLHQAPRAVAQLLHVAIDRGISHAKLSLRPTELGGIEIRLQSSQAGVTAQVIADSPEAAKLLQQAADDLRRSLERHDVTLLSLDVSTARDDRFSGSSGASSDLTDEAARHHGPHGRGDRADPAPDELPAVQATVMLPDGLLVDVLA